MGLHVTQNYKIIWFLSTKASPINGGATSVEAPPPPPPPPPPPLTTELRRGGDSRFSGLFVAGKMVHAATMMPDFLRQCGGVAVIDGGFATELERHGADLNDPLWSAKCLLTSPDLIRRVWLTPFRFFPFRLFGYYIRLFILYCWFLVRNVSE